MDMSCIHTFVDSSMKTLIAEMKMKIWKTIKHDSKIYSNDRKDYRKCVSHRRK